MNFYLSKDRTKSKKTSHKAGEDICNYIYLTEYSHSEYTKNLCKSVRSRQQIKYGKKPCTGYSQKRIFKWTIIYEKGFNFISQIKKYRLKAQCKITVYPLEWLKRRDR